MKIYTSRKKCPINGLQFTTNQTSESDNELEIPNRFQLVYDDVLGPMIRHRGYPQGCESILRTNGKDFFISTPWINPKTGLYGKDIKL
jgi:hypothetical protein